MDIASLFITHLKEKRILNKRNTWARNYKFDYFYDITKYCIIPLLEKSGYTLGVSAYLFATRLRDWCWAHERANDEGNYVYISDPIHYGTQDDYDWYLHNCSSTMWDDLYAKCKVDGIFDDSDAGESQKIGLPEFVWNQIDLSRSKAYAKTCALRELYEDDDWPQQEIVVAVDPE
jgi:hypothetical protein